MNDTFEIFQDAVIRKAREIVNDPTLRVCVDSLRESYKHSLDIESAAQIVLDDTAYWDNNV